MGKDLQPPRRQASRSHQPYDSSHSFVRRVASRVSGYFGSFFAPGSSQEEESGNSEQQLQPSTHSESSSSHLERFKESDSRENNNDIRLALPRNNHLELRNSEDPDLSFENNSPLPGPSGQQSTFPRLTSVELRPSTSGVSTRYPPSMRLNAELGSECQLQPFGSFARFESSDAKLFGTPDDRSESSESTSGCSSLIPQADRDRLTQSAIVPSTRRKSMALDDKLSYARQLKQSRSSFYMNRSIPVNAAETLRPSRTPGFDVSAYGSPIFNKSNVRETMLSSPFYTGHTTYGGSAARRVSIGSAAPRHIPVRAAASANPINMSQTAKRILAALEEFSSPLSDARRIPAPAPFAVKRRAVEAASESSASKRPALVIPVVADLIKMRRLEQIQDSTAAARKMTQRSGKIVTKVKDRDKPKIDTAPMPKLDLPQVSLPITTLPKFDLPPLQLSKSSFAFSAPSTLDGASRARNVAAGSLTEFDFSPPTSLAEYQQQSTPLGSIHPTTAPKRIEPIPKSSTFPKTELRTGSVMDILGKNAGKSHSRTWSSDSFEQKVNSDQCSDVQLKSISDSRLCSTCKEDSSKCSGCKPKSEGFGDKFKPSPGSWSCSECLVSNTSVATKCIACDSSRHNVPHSCPQCKAPMSTPSSKCVSCDSKSKSKEIKPVSGFGNMFKPAAGSWSCSSCMIVNLANALKCVACETEKSGTSSQKSSAADNSKPSISSFSSNPSSFGDKFKAPLGSWSCSTCYVSNDASARSCVACDSPKCDMKMNASPKQICNNKDEAFKPTSVSQLIPSGFGDKFKPAPGSWTCGSCLVSNTGAATTCVACDTAKPVSSGSGDMSKHGWCFGTSPVNNIKAKSITCDTPESGTATTTNGPPSSGPWDCSLCLKHNQEGETCFACNTQRPLKDIGNKTKLSHGLQPGGTSFKFWIDNSDADVTTLPNGPSSANKPSTFPSLPTSTSAAFTFGIPAATNATAAAPVEEKKEVMFKFGTQGDDSADMDTKSPSKPTENNLKLFNPAASESLKSEVSQAAPGFGFNGTIVSKPAEFGFSAKTVTTSSFGSGFATAATTPSLFTDVNPFAAATPTFPTSTPKPDLKPNSGMFMFGGPTNPPANTFSFGTQQQCTEAKPLTFSEPSQSNGVFTFGASTPNPFGVSSSTTANAPSPFRSTFADAPTPFGAVNTQLPSESFGAVSASPFGQAAAPASFSAQPFQFGALSHVAPQQQFPTPTSTPLAAPTSLAFPTSTSFSLSVPTSFNFTGGQTPQFNATTPPQEPRRIIRAARRKR